MREKEKKRIRVSLSGTFGQDVASQGKSFEGKGKASVEKGGFDTGTISSTAKLGGNPSTRWQADTRASSRERNHQPEVVKATIAGTISETSRLREQRAEGLFPDAVRSFENLKAKRATG